jgi:hypothetical protein
VLNGYLPATRNRLKGSHWSALHREKLRALAALESSLGYSQDDPAIGTDTPSRSYKTALFTLVSWRVTNGIDLRGASSLKRFTRSPKKELK